MKKIKLSELKSGGAVSPDYEFHEYCKLFPMMDESDFMSLKKDIEKNGLKEPIVLYEGKILDGKCRHRACLELGVPLKTFDWDGDGTPLDFVISKNIARRQLTKSQRAVIAEEYLHLFEAEAKKRQGHGKTAPGKSLSEKIPEASKGKATEKAADVFGVSEKYIENVKSIRKQCPELLPDLKAGKIDIKESLKKAKNKANLVKVTEASRIFKQNPDFTISCGDMEVKMAELPDDSIDSIITDPPYAGEYLHLWESLGELAAKKLKDGGFLVAHCGHDYQYEVQTKLRQHLNYFWLVNILHNGKRKIIEGKNMVNECKLVLIFFKGKLKDREKTRRDVIKCGRREKDFHGWQQSLDATRQLIREYSEPGNLILDPLAGSGTTLVGCFLEGRRAIGIDNDEKCIPIIQGRLQLAREGIDPAPHKVRSVVEEIYSDFTSSFNLLELQKEFILKHTREVSEHEISSGILSL